MNSVTGEIISRYFDDMGDIRRIHDSTPNREGCVIVFKGTSIADEAATK